MHSFRVLIAILALCEGFSVCAQGQTSRYEELARLPLKDGFLAPEDSAALMDELFFQRAVQTYLWALPALNMYGMKEGSEKIFGKGYNVLPIFKERLNAKTLITTPNSDVIYALGYLDLKEDGPMVIEVPPGLQGILDDFWQRPICSGREIDGRNWCGDVGLPGPDKGKGRQVSDPAAGLPGRGSDRAISPIAPAPMACSSSGAAFSRIRKQLEEPVRVMEQTRIYPLGRRTRPSRCNSPTPRACRRTCSIRKMAAAFDMLARFIEHEYVDPADMEMRGMAASLGIVKGQPFAPDDQSPRIARQGGAHGHAHRPRRGLYAVAARKESAVVSQDRHWHQRLPGGNATFTADSFDYIDARTAFFTYAYSTSPGMAVSMENVGAKYPSAFSDADGDFLQGRRNYKLHLPKRHSGRHLLVGDGVRPDHRLGPRQRPALSVTQHDGQAGAERGRLDRHLLRTEVAGRQARTGWRRIPDKGFFVIFRLYGPTKAFFDKTWKPGDLEKQN